MRTRTSDPEDLPPAQKRGRFCRFLFQGSEHLWNYRREELNQVSGGGVYTKTRQPDNTSSFPDSCRSVNGMLFRRDGEGQSLFRRSRGASSLVIRGRASPGFLAKRLKADDPQFGHIAVEHGLEFVPFRNKAVHPWLAAAIDLAGELVEIRADLVDGTVSAPRAVRTRATASRSRREARVRLRRRAFRIMELTDSPRFWAIRRMAAASCGLMRIVTMLVRCRFSLPLRRAIRPPLAEIR